MRCSNRFPASWARNCRFLSRHVFTKTARCAVFFVCVCRCKKIRTPINTTSMRAFQQQEYFLSPSSRRTPGSSNVRRASNVGVFANVPGVARRLVTFFASPKKRNPKKATARRCPSGSRTSNARLGKRNQLAALRHVSLLYPSRALLARQRLKRIQTLRCVRLDGCVRAQAHFSSGRSGCMLRSDMITHAGPNQKPKANLVIQSLESP
jgi:hypothetical protein